MVFIIYSVPAGSPKIEIVGCVNALDVAQETMKRKVRTYISYHEGEMKNQVACRPSLQDLNENKDLKDGLYYICKPNTVEIYHRTMSTISGWVYNSYPVMCSLVSTYLFVEVSGNVLGIPSENSRHDTMMREIQQHKMIRKEDSNSKSSSVLVNKK